MAINISDIKIFLSQNNPEDDSSTTGGGIAATSGYALKASFKDLSASDTVQVISSKNTDTAPVVIKGRDSGGAIVSETETLTGAAPSTTTQSFERFLSVLKSAATTGDVAVERSTATRANTVQGAEAASSTLPAYLRLDSSASSVDDTYNNMVLRIPAGTGSGQIREIIDYVGSTRRAYVNRDWETVPASGDPFRVSEGVLLDSYPIMVSGCRRLFYGVTANPGGGADLGVMEKVFVRNCHSSLTLTNAKVQLTQDNTSGQILDIALESGLNLNTSVANRLTAPTSVTEAYSTSLKTVSEGGNLAAGYAQGIWISGAIGAGLAPEKSSFVLTTTGSST